MASESAAKPYPYCVYTPECVAWRINHGQTEARPLPEAPPDGTTCVVISMLHDGVCGLVRESVSIEDSSDYPPRDCYEVDTNGAVTAWNPSV